MITRKLKSEEYSEARKQTLREIEINSRFELLDL